MSDHPSVDAALSAAHRDDWAVVLGATVRTVRDLDLAEECVQDAYADALRSWPVSGVPANPAAWLTTTARRRAIDVVRRERTFLAKLPLLIDPDGQAADDPSPEHPRFEEGLGAMERIVPDDRLRLVLLCSHPALGEDARVALTLRLVCGVPTADIARAFLVPEATMAARLTRAKRKIQDSGIAFRLPAPSQMPERLRQVAALVHLLFTTGHVAPSGEDLLRAELADEALRLAGLLTELVPGDAELRGLLALLLATDARRDSRTDSNGGLVRLADQDRRRWDRRAIAEARSLVLAALPDPSAGRYCLQAAIAVLHAEAPSFAETDWAQVVGLHDRLLAVWQTPVVALNRAVALAELRGPAAGLAAVDALAVDDRLNDYPYLHAVRADLLVRLSRPGEAADAWRSALRHTANAAEAAFLRTRLAEIDEVGPSDRAPSAGAPSDRAPSTRSDAAFRRGYGGDMRSTPPFRADVVGSFLRPASIKQARLDAASGAMDAAALHAVEDAAIRTLVAREAEAGLRVATDGEFRRAWWHFDFFGMLDGVEIVEQDHGIQFTGVETKPHGIRVTGPIRFPVDHPMLEHFRTLAADVAAQSGPHDDDHAATPVMPKMTIPSPTVLHFRLGRGAVDERVYATRDALFADLAAAYRDAVRAFHDAGCRYLQFDDTAWAYLCSDDELAAARARGTDTEGLAEAYAALINDSLRGRPEDMTITTHVCRGNFRSTWISSGGYEPIAEQLLAVCDYDGYFLEYDSERAGGFGPLRFLPAGEKVVVLGLVTTKTGALEDRAEIRRRIEEATQYVAIGQLALSPQCGFASTEDGNDLSDDEQWAKIREVVAVAAEVWPA